MEDDGFQIDGEAVDDAVDVLDLVEDLDAVVWEADPQSFDFTFVNRRAVDLLGYPRAAWYQPQFWATQLIHPEDRAATVSTCRNAVAEGRDHEIEYRAQAADGRVLWLRDMIRVGVDDDGRVITLRGLMLDVTAEKAARLQLAAERERLEDLAHEQERTLEALRASEAHYRRLVRTSPYGVFVADRDGYIVEANPAGESMLGRSERQLLGHHYLELTPPERLDWGVETFQTILTGTGMEVEAPVRLPDGSTRLLSIAAAPIIEDLEPIGVHAIARDVTEERRSDMRRRLLAAALDNLPDAVAVIDPSLRFVYTNRVYAKLLGFDPNHPPANLRSLVPDEESQRQLDEIRAALEHERRWAGRVRRQRVDGTVVVLSATIFAVSDGTDGYALAVMRDASAELARDQHMRRVERLASLGTLIGGVAHELNNPLTAVIGFAHLMLLDEHSADDRETLETIAREAERAARIVADLRLVARNSEEQGRSENGLIDLNRVVHHVLTTRRNALDRYGIEVVEDLAERLPAVRGNRVQLEQAVVNLIVNAEQALVHVDEDSRRLTLRTRRSRLGAALHVADNGPGIQREHLDRVFDPFFTTRPPGEGTGLGLSLVHSIVTEHRGSLRVESAPGRGAEFIVELPSADGDVAAAAEGPASPIPEIAARSLRVLVVDDEATIRELLVRALGRRGHSVIEARDGTEALRLIEDLDAPFDVIVSDLRMPGLGGEELLSRLREQRPGLADRVVFITADAPDAGFGAHTRIDVPVLMKPFQLDQVATLVEQRVRQGATSSG